MVEPNPDHRFATLSLSADIKAYKVGAPAQHENFLARLSRTQLWSEAFCLGAWREYLRFCLAAAVVVAAFKVRRTYVNGLVMFLL
jgi:hypothetical protein